MLTNTEETMATADFSTIVALDAFEAKSEHAPALMVGMPATVSIGCDSYAGTVVSVSKSLKTIEVKYGFSQETRTFRQTKYGWTSKKHFRLSLGTAENHWALEV